MQCRAGDKNQKERPSQGAKRVRPFVIYEGGRAGEVGRFRHAAASEGQHRRKLQGLSSGFRLFSYKHQFTYRGRD